MAPITIKMNGITACPCDKGSSMPILNYNTNLVLNDWPAMPETFTRLFTESVNRSSMKTVSSSQFRQPNNGEKLKELNNDTIKDICKLIRAKAQEQVSNQQISTEQSTPLSPPINEFQHDSPRPRENGETNSNSNETHNKENPFSSANLMQLFGCLQWEMTTTDEKRIVYVPVVPVNMASQFYNPTSPFVLPVINYADWSTNPTNSLNSPVSFPPSMNIVPKPNISNGPMQAQTTPVAQPKQPPSLMSLNIQNTYITNQAKASHSPVQHPIAVVNQNPGPSWAAAVPTSPLVDNWNTQNIHANQNHMHRAPHPSLFSTYNQQKQFNAYALQYQSPQYPPAIPTQVPRMSPPITVPLSVPPRPLATTKHNIVAQGHFNNITLTQGDCSERSASQKISRWSAVNHQNSTQASMRKSLNKIHVDTTQQSNSNPNRPPSPQFSPTSSPTDELVQSTTRDPRLMKQNQKRSQEVVADLLVPKWCTSNQIHQRRSSVPAALIFDTRNDEHSAKKRKITLGDYKKKRAIDETVEPESPPSPNTNETYSTDNANKKRNEPETPSQTSTASANVKNLAKNQERANDATSKSGSTMEFTNEPATVSLSASTVRPLATTLAAINVDKSAKSNKPATPVHERNDSAEEEQRLRLAELNAKRNRTITLLKADEMATAQKKSPQKPIKITFKRAPKPKKDSEDEEWKLINFQDSQGNRQNMRAGSSNAQAESSGVKRKSTGEPSDIDQKRMKKTIYAQLFASDGIEQGSTGIENGETTIEPEESDNQTQDKEQTGLNEANTANTANTNGVAVLAQNVVVENQNNNDKNCNVENETEQTAENVNETSSLVGEKQHVQSTATLSGDQYEATMTIKPAVPPSATPMPTNEQNTNVDTQSTSANVEMIDQFPFIELDNQNPTNNNISQTENSPVIDPFIDFNNPDVFDLVDTDIGQQNDTPYSNIAELPIENSAISENGEPISSGGSPMLLIDEEQLSTDDPPLPVFEENLLESNVANAGETVNQNVDGCNGTTPREIDGFDLNESYEEMLTESDEFGLRLSGHISDSMEMTPDANDDNVAAANVENASDQDSISDAEVIANEPNNHQQFGRQNAITSTTSSERTLDEGVDEIEPGNHDDPLSLLEASPHIDSDDQKEIGRNRRARLLAEMQHSKVIICSQNQSNPNTVDLNSELLRKERLNKKPLTIPGRCCVVVERVETAIPKNTNADMTAVCGAYQLLCILCNTVHNKLVHHYTLEHSIMENYISRMSPNLLSKIENELNFGIPRGPNITGQCGFCEEKFKLSRNKWIVHITKHTGEYGFYCDRCNVKTANPKHAKCPVNSVRPLYTISVDSNEILVNVCKMCKFTQLREENVISHVQKQHEITENIETFVKKVPFLKFKRTRSKHIQIANDSRGITNESSTAESITILSVGNADVEDMTRNDRVLENEDINECQSNMNLTDNNLEKPSTSDANLRIAMVETLAVDVSNGSATDVVNISSDNSMPADMTVEQEDSITDIVVKNEEDEHDSGDTNNDSSMTAANLSAASGIEHIPIADSKDTGFKNEQDCSGAVGETSGTQTDMEVKNEQSVLNVDALTNEGIDENTVQDTAHDSIKYEQNETGTATATVTSTVDDIEESVQTKPECSEQACDDIEMTDASAQLTSEITGAGSSTINNNNASSSLTGDDAGASCSYVDTKNSTDILMAKRNCKPKILELFPIIHLSSDEEDEPDKEINNNARNKPKTAVVAKQTELETIDLLSSDDE